MEEAKSFFPSGRSLRPTSQYFRNMLFTVLQEEISGAKFLDLFAGTGIVALEALSRGAESAVLVEKSRINARLIHQNLRSLGVEDKVKVLACDFRPALRWLKKRGEKFDVVFLDPPYSHPSYLFSCLKLLAGGELFFPDSVLAVKSTKDVLLPPEIGPLTLKATYHQGRNYLYLYRGKE